MSTLVKFWIAATLVLLVLALWPATQFRKGAGSEKESDIEKEAKLVDFFCLARIPSSGMANIPKAWEKVLDADIKIRESAGEAAGEIGIPRDQASKLTDLKPGEGLLFADDRFVHYVLRSGQVKDWFIVLTKKNTGGIVSGNSSGGRKPSTVSLAIGFALVGGALMALLARVAFGKTPDTQ